MGIKGVKKKVRQAVGSRLSGRGVIFIVPYPGIIDSFPSIPPFNFRDYYDNY